MDENLNRVRSLFSVIIPTYNRANTITETLDSVKDQTYRPVEIIIVDDGSDDETGKIIAEWTEKNQEAHLRITYEYQTNAGAGAARNRGIAICNGECIQFLDSDDTIYANRLGKHVEKFRKGFEFIETGFEGFIINSTVKVKLFQRIQRSNANEWYDLGIRCLGIRNRHSIKLNLKNHLKTCLLRYYNQIPKLSRFLICNVFKLPK